MKALSVRPEWAMPIMWGAKTVEHRTWKTDYRGPLLICASSRRAAMSIAGHAVCVARLADIVPFAPEHAGAALMDGPAEGWAWLLDRVEWIRPFPVKGRLHLFDVEARVRYAARTPAALERYYEPLMTWGGVDRTNPAGSRLSDEEARGIWDGLKATLRR